ncbi:MAG TPA: dienelactone hydrolase family protein [Dehalococcoidia bacterium]|jgi:carboxymethylenebutenolidase|nr:dienelactone hydrolase family protein [Dehalococcoidia bacterium]
MVSQIIPPGSVFHPSQIHAYEVRHPGYESFAVPAYVARPSGPGAFPALILTHGVHGYEEHMKEVARRFAVLGYACIVPALYCRDDFLAVVEEEDLARASASLSSRHNAQTVGDLTGSLAYLQNSRFVNGRIGLVGFCSGGRLAMIFACQTNGLSAFVNFYSNSVFQPTEANPTPAGDLLQSLSCPMLGLFGDEDTNPSPADVEQLRSTLKESSKTFELVSYKEAGHAFFSDTRPSYRPEVAYMAWGRCLEWLSRYLKP